MATTSRRLFHPVGTLRSVLLYAAAATVMACGGADQRPRSRDSAIAWPDTASAEWIAYSIAGRPVIPGTRVTLETSPGGVGGYTGCNWYGARRGDIHRGLEMTARACTRPTGIDEQERRFANALQRATTAAIRHDSLVLRDSSGVEVLAFVLRRPSPVNPAQLVGTSWRLRASTMPGLDTTRATLRFSSDSVSGFGGCRNLTGTYAARGDRLRFTYIAMGSLECRRDRARDAEELLTTALGETEHFDIRDGSLLLTTFGGDTLRFSPQ